jgi:hypothetical protein
VSDSLIDYPVNSLIVHIAPIAGLAARLRRIAHAKTIRSR